MEFDTGDLYAPLVGSLVEDGAELGVDRVAGGEGLIELKFSYHVSQSGLGEFLDCVREVVDFIYGLYRVDDLEVEQGIDSGGHVILGDHALLREVIDLLPEVDLAGGAVAHIGVAIHVNYGVTGVYHPRAVYDRPDDVDSGLEGPVVLSEPFDHPGFCLRDDPYAAEDEDYHYENDNPDNDCS